MPLSASPPPAPPLSLVLCVRSADVAPLRQRLAAIRDALAADHEVVLVGAGDPAFVAPALRRLAADPRVRVLLHTRRRTPDEALNAGVDHAQGRWIVALPDTAGANEGETIAVLCRHAATTPQAACVHAGAGQPLLFTRAGFLALAPIARMRSYLPELFARAGADVHAIVDAGRHDAATSGFARWLRRTRVALLCRMAAFGATARA